MSRPATAGILILIVMSACATPAPPSSDVRFGDDPKGRASRYLYENGESAGLDVVSITEYLGRAYGFDWGSKQVDRIVGENSASDAPGYLYLRLFGRKLTAEEAENPVAIGLSPDRGNLVYLPATALHCDSVPLPSDFFERVESERAKGGYHLTHALVAVRWASEQGCVDAPSTRPVVEGLVREMQAEVSARVSVDDLFAELLAMIAYGGAAPDPDSMSRLLDAQRPDGSIPSGEPDTYPQHSTALALTAMYFSELPTDVTWIPAPGPPAAPPRKAS